MPKIEQSVIVDCPVAFTIDVSNRIEDWPLMMGDYESVEIIRREGWKVWFRLKNREGASWISWRVVDHDGAFALAERSEPRSPFAFMQHCWLYEPSGRCSTQMTWIMTFQLPKESQHRESEACQYLRSHSAENQKSMKGYIEQQFRVATPATNSGAPLTT
jgi:aromatase